MSRTKGVIEVGKKRYPIVTLDFETYYGKNYTLSGKLNTSEYVRDARFKAHGVGIKHGCGKTKWYTGKNIPLALKEIDWSNKALLCHNTPFDGFILSHHYGIKPAFVLDTLAMSRAIHGHTVRHDLDSLAKRHGRAGKVKRSALANTKDKVDLTKAETAALGGYCVDDTNDTYDLFWDMYDHMPDSELRLVDITTKMFTDPVLKIDVPRIEVELDKEIGGKIAALLTSGATAEDLLSNDKFAVLLAAAGARVPRKVSPTTGKVAFAFAKTDEGMKLLLDSDNPRIKALANARLKLKSTIGETRAVRFIEAGKDDMPFPILLNYSGAHTHRWSGGNKMNLQNLPRGGELRKAILAPAGWAVVVADSAQIEARVLAWLAKQMDIVTAFQGKRDLYSEFASLIYGRTITKADAKERHVGKVCILGLGYGMGPDKLQGTLKAGALGGPPIEMSRAQCVKIVNIYRQRNANIVRLWKDMDNLLGAMSISGTGNYGPLTFGKNFIQLPSELFLHYPGLTGVPHHSGSVDFNYMSRYGFNKIYGGLLTENVVQALARVIIGDQILAVADAGYRVVSMTHDEIIAIAPIKQADKCLKDMIKIMSTPPAWAPGLPLAAEGGWDINYSK